MNLPNEGQRIRFRRKVWRAGQLIGWQEGYGTVAHVWCGCEETIKLTDGSDLFPGLGETWEPAEVAKEPRV